MIVRRVREIICKELQGKVMNSYIPKAGYEAPGGSTKACVSIWKAKRQKLEETLRRVLREEIRMAS
jgi:hypothetical protein